jgi:hypothetical protein
MIKVSIDIKPTLAMLAGAQKQVEFSAAVAVTRTAKRIEKSLRKDLSTLDATKYTKEGTFSTSATKAKLEAKVGIKDKKPGRGTSPAVLLKEHFGGGTRGNKPMEKALSAMGALPSGWRVVAGSGMKLDRYGNPTRNEVKQLLGSLRTGIAIYKGRGKRSWITGYFVILPNVRSHLQPGIYKRTNRMAIRPMLIFIKAATYRVRFDLPAIARDVVSQHFNAEFIAAYQAALATAK